MGVLVMVIGQSGSGKSTSLRNFWPGMAEIYSVIGKPLPFRNDLEVKNHVGYDELYEALRLNASDCYVIDDSTYLMQLDNFARCQVKGYDKFTEMALSFERLLEWAAHTRPETVTYFLHHPQFNESGATKPQTIGKMLDSQLNVEGLFTVVLEADVVDGHHIFWTNAHGITKSPYGMFRDQVIDNDLAYVDAVLRTYWGFPPLGGDRT